MSRTFFRKPGFRLALDYPNIALLQSDRPQAVAVAAIDGPGSATEIGKLAAVARTGGGRVTVVLPADEVWRGSLTLGSGGRRARRQAARAAAADHLAVRPDAVALAIGRQRADGTTPVAAARRTSVEQARAFARSAGMRPAAVVGGGDFPGFDAAPRLDAVLPEIPRPAAAAAAGAALVALILAAGWRDADPTPTVAIPAVAIPVAALPEFTPATVAGATFEPVAEPDALVTADLRPQPRPASHRVTRAVTLPASIGALVDGKVTVASRNSPPTAQVRAVVRAPEPSLALRLGELDTARARLEAGSLPLHRVEEPQAAANSPAPGPTAPTSPRLAAEPVSAASTDFRPARRPAAPKPQAAAPTAPKPQAAAVPAPKAPAAKVASADTGRPPQRPDNAASNAEGNAAVAAAVTEAVATAAREPAPVQVASLGTSPAALAALAVAQRPAPRDVAEPVRSAAPVRTAALTPSVPSGALQRSAPAVVKLAPVAVVRPAPATAKPAPVVKQASKPAPVVQRVSPVAAAAPRVAPPAPKVARVSPVVTQPKSVQPQRVQTAAAPKPTRVQTRSARAADETTGIERGSVSLMGIFGSVDDRHALVLLPNGKVEKVRAGDRIQGTQVASVGEASVRLTGRGRDQVLKLPE